MNAFTGRFRLDRAPPFQPALITPIASISPDDLSSAQTFGGKKITFRAYPNPTAPPAGSFLHDLAKGKYLQRWESWPEFEDWLAREQQDLAIELRHVNTYSKADAYLRKLRYVCSRGGTGGRKEYNKLHPNWTRKCEGKRTDCKCSLVVKEYPGVSTVLGDYVTTHNHPLGNANLRFTRIPKETREYIAGLLRLGVTPDRIVRASPLHHFFC